jgi:beta-xylosidase
MRKDGMKMLNQQSKTGISLVCCLLCVCINNGQAWQSDNGDGTYTNPPLYADFPDPDIIRVGEDFYFATTTFVNVPGLTILHSQDLVNWEYVSHVINRLEGRPEYDLQGGTAYRSGVFAPSLRYYQGTFYVVVTPVGQNTRIYMAEDANGPWSYHELTHQAFDPGLFIDDDGKGYIATSGGWDGTLTLLALNEDFTEVVDAREVYYNKGAEGSKIVKRGDWYYLFNSIPSRLGMTVSRAKSLYGPWETKTSINDRTGGHQGAIVDLPDGGWYGFVMKDFKSIGRMTNISPIFWQDDWPIWGTQDAPDQVPDIATKPIQDKPIMQPATSDEFDSNELGLQWQWNHNPDDTRWSLTERPGYLRLKATRSDGFWTARNTLTQKGWGPWCRGTVTLDLSNLKPGDICGFGTLGKFNGHIAITCDEQGELLMGMRVIEDTRSGLKTDERVATTSIDGTTIMLRIDLDFENDKGLCSYSIDGTNWTPLGGEFELAYDWQTGTFQGEQFAIFCYNPEPGEGFVDVDSFVFSDQRPAQRQRVR